MFKKECVRCHEWYRETEMYYLGFKDDGGEDVYSCEGCLLPLEQDLFYGQYCVMLHLYS